MTNFKPDDDLAEWDAAYVLGALSLDDRRTYEDYLATNPARAAEVVLLEHLQPVTLADSYPYGTGVGGGVNWREVAYAGSYGGG